MISQTAEASLGGLAWFQKFLKDELAPFPGRGRQVARMVLASTLLMLISMTFRLPYGAFGSIYALVLSRDSLEATARDVWGIAVGFAVAEAWLIFGFQVALADPAVRFVWIAAGLFLGFWAMSALRDFAASSRFGYLIAITITLWDKHDTPSAKVEDALWAGGVIIMASLLTLAVEVLFHGSWPGVVHGISERLASTEDFLLRLADDDPRMEQASREVAKLAQAGTSRMRQALRRSGFNAQSLETMGAVVALTGRLVDLVANVPYLTEQLSAADRQRVLTVVARIRAIRETLVHAPNVTAGELTVSQDSPTTLPLLREIEQTLDFLGQALVQPESQKIFSPGPTPARQRESLLTARLFDRSHIRFGLRGCVASTMCYVVFNALEWPQISTAVTTCFLTALTTIGASRQKQFLRITGAMIGGFGVGMGAQIFILPYVDSIPEFTILFAVTIAFASWIATSTPRLSYFGLQVAVAFCLITVQEFRFQTSLTVARDRVLGILLGLLMMWLFFDQLWSQHAGDEMKRIFVESFRLLARLTRGTATEDLRLAIEETSELRAIINARLDTVRALADSVLFEFGDHRRRDLAMRAVVRQLQPQLRTLFVLRIALLKYRLQTPGFALPPEVITCLKEYDMISAGMLEEIAIRVESDRTDFGDPGAAERDLLRLARQRTEDAAVAYLAPGTRKSLIRLLHATEAITVHLVLGTAT